MFKSKHKLDLGIVSFEQRGNDLFGYSEVEFSNKGIYDLVHPEDLTYVAQAHNERKSMTVELGLKTLLLGILSPTSSDHSIYRIDFLLTMILVIIQHF